MKQKTKLTMASKKYNNLTVLKYIFSFLFIVSRTACFNNWPKLPVSICVLFVYEIFYIHMK